MMLRLVQYVPWFLVACFACSSLAQTFPDRTIKVVVPYPAGGITDGLGRTIAKGLEEAWGRPAIVENRAGAAGNIGSDFVAKAAPDGYTLLVNSGPTMVISQALFGNLPYDPLKDLAPVTQAVLLPNILVVRPTLPATTVKELIALLKANPGKFNFASAGSGTVGHMAGELFKQMAGVDMVHIPYKGAAPAMTDLLAGRVDLFFDTIASALPHVKAGKLRVLGISSAKGSPLLPDVPTIAQAGVPGFDANPSFGVFAPAGTPAVIVDRLGKEIARILDEKGARQRLEALGAEIATDTPDQFGAYMREQSVKWANLIRDAKIVATQ
jgi:tripartite-type tricarboxylate transporter receptor subunit TctC